jgi:hypothetical protein
VFIEGMEESVVKAYLMTDGFHHCHFGFAPAHGDVFQALQRCLARVIHVPRTTKAKKIPRRFIAIFFVHLRLFFHWRQWASCGGKNETVTTM